MKPIIGLTVSIENDATVTAAVPYFAAIEKAGGLPLILPYVREETIAAFVDACDGIFLTGGKDICPARYKEATSPLCGETQPLRDETELAVARLAIAADKPILAICRGLQLINVALGGTLYQDLPVERPTAIPHRQEGDIFAPSHDILIAKDTPLFSLIEKERMAGNSFHHQAVKTLGGGLAAMAYAEDSTVEALYAPALTYLRAYQFHPERLYDKDGDNRKIFTDFIKAATLASNTRK